jgi:hypothetical protein
MTGHVSTGSELFSLLLESSPLGQNPRLFLFRCRCQVRISLADAREDNVVLSIVAVRLFNAPGDAIQGIPDESPQA